MWIRPESRYIQPCDVQAVGDALSSRAPPLLTGRVQFHPNGDGTLFLHKLPAPWIPYMPAFTEAPPPAMVFHLSRTAFPGFNETVLKTMREHGVDPDRPTHVREETEKWYVYFPKELSDLSNDSPSRQ